MEESRLKLVIVGEVDHGKSTLTGRLLFETNSIPPSVLEEIRVVSSELGKEMEFSYLLDSLQEERERNITIDSTQTFFKTERRNYTIIDAPGHREFLKNMLTGASQADAGVLIVDAARGIEEQTRRHAFLLGLLGIGEIIVVVNKMDLVDYQESVFRELERSIGDFFSRAGLTFARVIPISAREGDNVKENSSKMPWYTGPALLGALDMLSTPKRSEERGLRFSVQDVYGQGKEGKERIVVGRVESGKVRAGDVVRILPGSEQAQVKTIEVWQEKPDEAGPGSAIGLTFSTPGEPARGNVLSRGDAPRVTRNLSANVFWIAGQARLHDEFTLECATQEVSCTVAGISDKIDSATLEPVEASPGSISETQVARMNLCASSDLVVEDFQALPELGRFVLVREGEIVAGGIVQPP